MSLCCTPLRRVKSNKFTLLSLKNCIQNTVSIYFWQAKKCAMAAMPPHIWRLMCRYSYFIVIAAYGTIHKSPCVALCGILYTNAADFTCRGMQPPCKRPFAGKGAGWDLSHFFAMSAHCPSGQTSGEAEGARAASTAEGAPEQGRWRAARGSARARYFALPDGVFLP